MMTLRLIGLSAVMAAGLALAGTAVAQPPGEFMHGRMGGPGMEFMHGLNLTDAQKSEAHQIEKSTWEATKPLMEKMRAVHEARMTALLGTGTVTAETLKPSVAEEEALREQIDAIHLNAMLQLRGLLSADQLADAAAKHTQIEELHEQEHALMGRPE
jgi:Spy/CpxP family protein refolding chaperone